VRLVPILGLGDVTRQDWREEIPAEARLGACEQRLHHTQDRPETEANSRAVEVCGTPYTKDTGTGLGQVVQDCEYDIYMDYCSYTVQDWQQVDQLELRGQDLNPQWPQANLAAQQKAGERAQSFTIVFHTENGEYEYNTSDEAEFRRFVPGSEWELTINAFGSIIAVKPKE
jgi:hypothetical protein